MYNLWKKENNKTKEKEKKQMSRTPESLAAVYIHTQVGYQ